MQGVAGMAAAAMLPRNAAGKRVEKGPAIPWPLDVQAKNRVQAFNGDEKVISAGGTFFGSPDNPRIVRVFSQATEIVPFGVVLLLNNKDRPGIVGYLGTLMARYKVNIASMSLSRDTAGGHALTVLNLDSVPPSELLEEIQKDPDITNVKVVKL